MNRQDQHGGSPEKSSASTRGGPHQKRHARARSSEARTETLEDWQAASDDRKGGDQPPVDQASFAYQLLLLQQRLAAYEQLHLEEIAELRQEIEQLRRAFLQETHPQLRAIASLRDTRDPG
jgi:hypothetical protein